jgi:signal transduction histidine kinase
MLASFSHELRTPLNGSISLLQILDRELSTIKSPLNEKYLKPALRSNLILINIINDILDFSQMEFG